MKKTLLSIGIGFYDLNITTDYKNKNHSHYATIQQLVGGSMVNIAKYVGDSGVVLKCGNDIHAQYIIDNLKNESIDVYPIFVDVPQPIFMIINEKERYTTLDNRFEIDDNTQFDFVICEAYQFGITNSKSAYFINKLLNTNCRWIVNSYINDQVDYTKLEGLILNREESSMYDVDPKNVLTFLKEKGLKWAIITLDKDGCLILCDGNIHQLKPNNTHLKSRVRTGDYFSAMLIRSLANGNSLLNSVRYAMECVEQFLIGE